MQIIYTRPTRIESDEDPDCYPSIMWRYGNIIWIIILVSKLCTYIFTHT